MAQTKKTIYEKPDELTASSGVVQQQYNTDVGSMQKSMSKPAYSVDPSMITQSFYTKPTNANNFETGKPVYTQSDALQQAASALQQQQNAKPGEYQGQYGDQIQELINQTLSRQKFSYDFSKDPMYAVYAQEYRRGGKMAMDDAMARGAALTGGYGNSYAQTVGQQTYQRYMEGLADKIPELRDAAYQMYQSEGDTMRQNLAMLQGQDQMEYSRYRDTVSDWQNDLNMLYTMYTDMSEAEYNRYLNDQAAWEADRNYWYQQAYDNLQQSNWQAQYDFNKAQAEQEQSNWQAQYEQMQAEYKQSQENWEKEFAHMLEAYNQEQANWEREFAEKYGTAVPSGSSSSGGSRDSGSEPDKKGKSTLESVADNLADYLAENSNKKNTNNTFQNPILKKKYEESKDKWLIS